MSLAALLAQSAWTSRIDATPAEYARMHASRAVLAAHEGDVYGLTRGFGPLVGYAADPDRRRQGLGLVRHLAVGQGDALPPRITRTMVWLRLRGMAAGHSGVDPAAWRQLADQWNAGFTPVVPRDGSLSASGDLVPLAHAALAAGGDDSQLAWRGSAKVPAAEALSLLGVPAVAWEARLALAFVNGSSACLAVAMHNHHELEAITRLAARTTGRLAALLGADPAPYSDALNQVRNQRGQLQAAAWIRSEIPPGHHRAPGRPLQERYSLRCAPQVLGAVLDQLRVQGEFLAREAEGCTDNPVIAGGQILHGGNFHAAPVGLVSDVHAVCAHQVALLMERQLALLVDPASNGGLPPLLTPNPGGDSGLAGVQIAASSHLSRIRQLGYPASMTPIPTNLENQDHTPMALNGATTVSEILTRLRWIAGSLLLATAQLTHLLGVTPPRNSLWAELGAAIPPLDRDRPLATAVVAAAELALPAEDRQPTVTPGHAMS
ncbi:aromatic amino acid lyase [Actinokineospora sp. HUAS TT18]|uniref:aromatic amino acid lyase n=1 Tax=Actinokineospora sp. HUAS TT18 TaxID=3447451 RepID=UPI003F52007F